MPVDISLTHPAPAPREITDEDRIDLLGELTSKQRTDALPRPAEPM